MTEAERVKRMVDILRVIRDDSSSLIYPTGLPSLRLITRIDELIGPGNGPLEPLAAAAGSHREQMLQQELDQAKAEVERFREREAHFAKALGVADAGQYRADWPSAIERLLHNRAEAQTALAKAADTLRDFQLALIALGHGTSAQTAAVAEQALRDALARSQRQGA